MERASLILNIILWDGDHASLNFKNWALKILINFIFDSKTEQKVQDFSFIPTSLAPPSPRVAAILNSVSQTKSLQASLNQHHCPLETAGQDGGSRDCKFWTRRTPHSLPACHGTFPGVTLADPPRKKKECWLPIAFPHLSALTITQGLGAPSGPVVTMAFLWSWVQSLSLGTKTWLHRQTNTDGGQRACHFL